MLMDFKDAERTVTVVLYS